MKKLSSLLLSIVFCLSSFLFASAENGKVTYKGNAENIIFEPGSEHSPTDLFDNFKSVMPGDTLTQKITVKNDEKNEVKVKIYLRSLGAHEDSAEFLSKLHLSVQISEENEMAYMFDAAANETAQLTEWTYLGTLYSGGEVDLDVVLNVPVELDNEFKNQIGYLDWKFMIEELPTEPYDPVKPGDDSNMIYWFITMLVSGAFVIILLLWRRKDKAQQTSQF